MKVSYYPGCTLKTKAKNMDVTLFASLKALGVEVEELPRWNCCGAVLSLADDDLLHLIAPVRNLIRAQEQGAEILLTACSMCYNTLARANGIIKNDEAIGQRLFCFIICIGRREAICPPGFGIRSEDLFQRPEH